MTEFGIVRRFTTGVPLFGQGAHSGDVYLIKTGAIKLVWVSSDGGEVITGVRWPGAWIGAESVLAKRANTAAAVTLVHSTMEQISAESFRQRMQSDPGFASRVYESFSHEILEQRSDLGSLGIEPAKKRFQNFLRKAAYLGADPICLPDGRLNLPLKKKELAAILAIEPGHLSRLLSELADEGAIALNKQWIVIRDIDAFLDPR